MVVLGCSLSFVVVRGRSWWSFLVVLGDLS